MATNPYVPDPRDPAMPEDENWAKIGAAELRALKNAFMRKWIPRRVETQEYTLVPEDVGQLIMMVNGGVIWIPKDFPPCLFGYTGLQTTRVAPIAGGEVTLNVPPSLMSTLYEDNAFAVVMQMYPNIWLVSGNLMFAPVNSTPPLRVDNPVVVLQDKMVVVQAQLGEVNTAIDDLDDRVTILEEIVLP